MNGQTAVCCAASAANPAHILPYLPPPRAANHISVHILRDEYLMGASVVRSVTLPRLEDE